MVEQRVLLELLELVELGVVEICVVGAVVVERCVWEEGVEVEVYVGHGLMLMT